MSLRGAPLIALIALGCAVSLVVWVYQAFVSATYQSAWWVLAWLADSPVNLATPIPPPVAAACVIASGAALFLCSLCGSRGRDAGASLASAGLVAAFWLSSPWHIAVLQIHGANAYVLALVPLAVTLVVARLCPRWAARSGLVMAGLGLLSACFLFGRVPTMNPLVLLFPHAGALGPWVLPQAFSPLIELLSLWLILQALDSLVKRLFELLKEARAPLFLLLLLLPLQNLWVSSEMIQVRANPRLALLHSLAYAESNPIVGWLEMEHFDLLGERVVTDTSVGRYARIADERLPPSYSIVVNCIQSGVYPATDSQADPDSLLIVRHLTLNERCGPRPGSKMHP